MKTWGAVAACVLAAGLHGQFLVQDIRPGMQSENPGSAPQSLVTAGSLTFFAANDGDHGTELWRTDGTNAGTLLVHDIRKGPGDSRPLSLVAWGNRVLFGADDGEHGYEPWISDGTAAGTSLVADLLPGNEGRVPVFVPAGPAFFMLTQSLEANGNRVWKSNGTVGGTTFVGAFPFSDAAPPSTAVLGGRLVMMVTNQLWISDGTAAGTIQLATVGAPFRSHRFLQVVGNVALFEAEDATHGNELWRTDGTVPGTSYLADLTPGTPSTRFFSAAVLGTDLVFGVDDSSFGSALWKSDGTLAGTQVLRNFPRFGYAKAPYPLGVVTNKVIFLVDDGSVGNEPWITDGTPAGTQLLLDIALGNNTCEVLAFFGTTSAGLAFFVANDQVHGHELWVTDGTSPGTRLVNDLEPGSVGSDALAGAALGNRLVFAPKLTSLGTEPWISDGTAAGTTLIRELRPPAALGCDAYGFATLNGTAYFVADDGVHGRETWLSDGTQGGTRLGLDAIPGMAGAGLTGWQRFRDRLLTFANLGTNHAQLVSWDGLATSYQVLADPAGTAVFGLSSQTVPGNDVLYFRYATVLPQTGSLWRTDGTTQGTLRLWQSSGDLVPFASLRNRLYFGRAITGASFELWVGDGTQIGSTKLATLTANVNQAPPTDFVILGTQVCFLAFDGNRTDLWTTNDTAAGTVAVTDASFGVLEQNFTTGRGTARMVEFQSSLWFMSQLGTPKQRLWKSDGTKLGSKPVRDFDDACQPMFTKLGDRLLFAAIDLAAGRELWATDGSVQGTTQLPDLVPGPIGGLEFSESITALGAGNIAVLAAHDGVRGIELWGTDGRTWIATADLNPGAASSLPSNFVRLGDRVLFVADNGTSGRELFAIGTSALGIGFVDSLGGGCPGSGDRTARIEAIGIPSIGNANFVLGIQDGRPSAAQVWVLGPTSLKLQLSGGCTSLVGPPWLTATGALDARGRARLPLPIPGVGALIGAELFIQSAIADPRGSYEGRFSFSTAVRVFLGR